MLINTVFYTMPPDREAEAEALLRELRDASLTEPGCLTFNVCRSIEAPNVFALYEEYRDQTALDAHFASEHFQRLGINGIRKLALQRFGYRLCIDGQLRDADGVAAIGSHPATAKLLDL